DHITQRGEPLRLSSRQPGLGQRQAGHRERAAADGGRGADHSGIDLRAPDGQGRQGCRPALGRGGPSHHAHRGRALAEPRARRSRLGYP
ncbi:MAG: hypothetical protein AVDCRST_MAG93-3477, partial [uncultured Chloroflexia bacterium]